MQNQQVVNLLKGLVIDGVNQANSGHPGGAMSSMDFAYLLFSEHLKFDPKDPKWMGRDRFILSAGHESMLLYSLLRAQGLLGTDDLKKFRKLHSKTPGHPENFMTPGVECTTGPLGQGAAMSVGFAIASTNIAATLKSDLFRTKTWVLLGDGCMQEGVTLGAASLAGHLQLNDLIWYYDKNKQQISGNISRATSDNEVKIFEGFGWNVISIDGHDHKALGSAIAEAKSGTTSKGKPTLIVGTSIMAKGAASVEGSHKTHGAPLSQEERKATKSKFEIPEGQDFYFPQEAEQHFRRNFATMTAEADLWRENLATKISTDTNFNSTYKGYFSPKSGSDLPSVPWNLQAPMATRNAFGEVIKCWATALPGLIGGSADLEPSNMTGPFAEIVGDFSADTPTGRNLAYGVREFPMSAISNGLALYGGLIPFDATFLSFADYSRPALRLGAIQRVRTIHEFTHDSFYLGEDGPTHQPIEHLMSLRAMPDMLLMRPGDSRETEVLLRSAVDLDRPVSICLTRQKLPLLDHAQNEIDQAAKGAWIVREVDQPTMIIFATGSELSLALRAATAISEEKIRVISVPCWELLDQQPQDYQDKILDWSCKKRISIEAGITLGWQKFVGSHGLSIGIDHYGASAPAEDLEQAYGFTLQAVCENIRGFDFDFDFDFG